MQTTPKKTKLVKYPLKSVASSGAGDIKVKNIVNKIEPATSSTLGKEMNTETCKPVKKGSLVLHF